jgi:MFS family permease
MGEARWRDLFTLALLPRAILVCLGIWLNAADSLVTATIMPSVVRNIGGYAFFAWPVATYLLGSILGGACAGYFAHSRGLRAALIASALPYIIGCTLSAFAGSMAAFLVGRFLQGAGAGLIVGMCYVAINTLFPGSHYRRVMALLSGVWGIATLFGPLLGGLFSQGNGWQTLFLMFAGQGVIFAIAALFLVPRVAVEDQDSKVPVQTLVFLSLAVIANLIAGVLENVALAGASLVLAMLLLVVALRSDASAPAHLFPRRVAHLADRAGQGYLAIFALNASCVGFSVYGAAILQAAYGLSPLYAGYVICMEAMGWTIVALIVAELPHSSDTFWIRLGVTVAALSVMSLIFTLPSGSIVAVVVSATALGGSFGAFWAFLTRRILELLPPAERSLGAGAMPTTQMLGNAVGAAFCGLIANALGAAQGMDRAHALTVALWLFVCAVPVALFGWFCGWRMSGGTIPPANGDGSSPSAY